MKAGELYELNGKYSEALKFMKELKVSILKVQKDQLLKSTLQG